MILISKRYIFLLLMLVAQISYAANQGDDSLRARLYRIKKLHDEQTANLVQLLKTVERQELPSMAGYQRLLYRANQRKLPIAIGAAVVMISVASIKRYSDRQKARHEELLKNQDPAVATCDNQALQVDQN